MDYMTALTAFKAAMSTDTLPAVINRQEVNAPCLWITLRGFDQWNICGTSAEAALRLYLIVGDRQDEAALLALSPHLAAVLALLEDLNLPVEAIESDQVQDTDTGTNLPAFRIETHLTV